MALHLKTLLSGSLSFEVTDLLNGVNKDAALNEPFSSALDISDGVEALN